MTSTQTDVNGASRTYLWEEAAAAVRRAIMLGDLKPGDRVSEAQLAERLGVSRMPARDAIRVLVKEGLLEQRYGATFVSAAAADVDQLYDVRHLLEGHAIRLAAGRVSPAAERELRRAMAAMRAAASANDAAAYQKADLAFHLGLCEAAGHRWLSFMWAMLAPTMAAAMQIADEIAADERRMTVRTDSHEALLDEVLRGDVDAALNRLDRRLVTAPEVLATRLHGPKKQTPN